MKHNIMIMIVSVPISAMGRTVVSVKYYKIKEPENYISKRQPTIVQRIL